MRPTELVGLVHVAKYSMKKATSDVNYELLRFTFLNIAIRLQKTIHSSILFKLDFGSSRRRSFSRSPRRCRLEVGEMRVEDADDVVAHHVDHVDVGQPGSQLPDHLAPVVGQHGVQLALVVTQRGVPGEDVVSVGIVKYWGGGREERDTLFRTRNNECGGSDRFAAA